MPRQRNNANLAALNRPNWDYGPFHPRVWATNNSGGALTAGQVVVADLAGDNQIITSTTQAHGARLAGVVCEGGANGDVIHLRTSGTAYVLIDAGGCARGDQLALSAVTAGSAQTAVAGDYVFGVALETVVGAGLCKAIFSTPTSTGAGGIALPHAVLSGTHTDSDPAACVTGDIIRGNTDVPPLWKRYPIGTHWQILGVNAGQDQPEWQSFDWDFHVIAAGGDGVHDHSSNPEGGILPVGSMAPGTAQYQILTTGAGPGFVSAWSTYFLVGTAGQTYAFPAAGGTVALLNATNAFTALNSFAAGITLNGASGANPITVPDNAASAARLLDAGATEYLRVISTNAQPTIVWNEGGADIDFRIESDNKSYLFFIDAATDRIAINAASPNSTLDIRCTGTDAGFNIGGTTTHNRIISLAPVCLWTNADYSNFAAMSQGPVIVPQDAITKSVWGQLNNFIPSNSTFNMSGATIGVAFLVQGAATYSGVISDYNDLYLGPGTMAAGSVTNKVALRIANQTLGTASNHALVTGTGLVVFGDRVAIGPTAAAAMLHVDQSSATGAMPVLLLDQADDDETMIEFVGTIGVGNCIEAVGAKTLTVTHFIKVELPGSLIRYIPVGTIA